MIECGVFTYADIVLGPSTAVCLDEECGQASEMSSWPASLPFSNYFISSWDLFFMVF